MIATTIEQSRHLLELGLDPKTADCNWNTTYGEWALCVGKNNLPHAVPAWSLEALLEVMPGGLSENWMVQSLTDGRFMASYSCPVCHKTFTADTSFEAVFNMVVWHLGGGSKNKKGVTDGRGTDCDSQK